MRHTLAPYREDGAAAARAGYPLEANPYRTATRDASGRAHPRPSGFNPKGDAWAKGWARVIAPTGLIDTPRAHRARDLSQAAAHRARGDYVKARSLLTFLRGERLGLGL